VFLKVCYLCERAFAVAPMTCFELPWYSSLTPLFGLRGATWELSNCPQTPIDVRIVASDGQEVRLSGMSQTAFKASRHELVCIDKGRVERLSGRKEATELESYKLS
jgi:hypothetical protein